MNTPTSRDPLLPRSPAPPSSPSTGVRRPYPARDMGIGYGRSSGYAATRSYAVAWTGAARFRCR